ncbi:MAG: tRNA preQ1(34) S-adenosylmethionine ribosyltransferase-isomerase QueA [Verrucomicrobiota bacterium]
MQTSDFDYELPEELIAQAPVTPRDRSRMLVLHRGSGDCELRSFADFADYFEEGDCLVVNDTRVIPARLFGHRVPSGGQIEILLVERCGEREWVCFLKPARRLKPGDRIALAGEAGEIVVVAKNPGGECRVRFDCANPDAVIEQAGHVPLPPYIRREDAAADRERYQTVYAEKAGAVAAPTAGLHFTRRILDQLAEKGVERANVTLHVGPGTFRPVQEEDPTRHEMHEEAYELSEETAEIIRRTRRRGGRVIAVGTTTVRVLETCADSATRTVRPGCGRTKLFLHPPNQPVVADALLTNFHLPRSTLLMLVSTFSSVEHVLAAYRLAVRERFRFYSYGDCMLLV